MLFLKSLMRNLTLSTLVFSAVPSEGASLCRDLFLLKLKNARTSSEETASRLVDGGYQIVEIRSQPSPGMSSKIIEEARQLKLHDDFKILSDLRERELSAEDRKRVYSEARQRGREAAAAAKKKGLALDELRVERRKSYVAELVKKLYESGPELLPAPAEFVRPRWTVVDAPKAKASTLATIERVWEKLVKRTPAKSRGSLIPLPYLVVIPGSRFQESYYWDSYFGIKAFIRTDRWDLAAMQVENFLFTIEHYGLVPNGMRDYYLSRSQPPLLTSMVREVIEAAIAKGEKAKVDTWLRERAYELLKRDYEGFWMNPETRFDKETGLNHHWDAHNLQREERHSADRDDLLGKTYRDVRAEAESGKDFTAAFEGQATRMAPVLLNSILYKAEVDLAWMARRQGLEADARRFEAAARQRREAIDRHLWDPVLKTYKDFHLDRKERTKVTTADVFVPLWAGLASRDQAAGVHAQLAHLEMKGGIVASDIATGKQWDAPYAWAPQQYFAIDGLIKHGYTTDAKRIAEKWTGVIDRINEQSGVILEKIDAVRGERPEEYGDKYVTQEGFLWTNAVYIWATTDVLGYRLGETPASPAAHAR